MPSGEQHAWYATSFREIDWLDLYERRDGYLLFEDLKAQWEQFVKPEWEVRADSAFSCWRYYEPSASEFQEDLDEIEALIDVDTSRRPRFMTAAEEASDLRE